MPGYFYAFRNVVCVLGWGRFICMKFLCGVLFGLGLGCRVMAATVVSYDVYGGNLEYNSDLKIQEFVKFKPDKLFVRQSIYLENNGNFDADIVVCERCNLYLKNSGVFTANVVLNPGAEVIYVLDNMMGAAPININSDYSVLVDGVNGAVLVDIVNDFADADKFVLKDSLIDISDVHNMASMPFEIKGEVSFIADDLTKLYGVPVLENVSGDGTVKIMGNVNNPMFVNEGYIRDGDLWVRRVRETDYGRILQNKQGIFLNKLRESAPNDRLLGRLDAAKSLAQIKDVMAGSVRFNQDILFGVVRSIEFDDFTDIFATNEFEARPHIVVADDFVAYGVDVAFGLRLNNTLVTRISARTGLVDFMSDVDSFKASFYGLSLGAKYQMDDVCWVYAEMGLMQTKTDITDVFYDDKILTRPIIKSGRGVLGIGRSFDFANKFYFQPSLGMVIQMDKVADISRIDVSGRMGAIAGYRYEMLGIVYDWGVGVRVGTNSDFDVMGRLGFLSTFDGAGGTLEFGVAQNVGVMSWRGTIGARLMF